MFGDEVRVLNRTRVNVVNFRLEGGRVFIELGKALDIRVVEIGYGRLYFRMGESVSLNSSKGF